MTKNDALKLEILVPSYLAVSFICSQSFQKTMKCNEFKITNNARL